MIRLIFNADDFGFTRDVNDGIIEAHRNGVLTATTLMANGDAFDHAVACARDTPTLDIGVHLVMVQGESVARPGHAMPATLQDLALALLRRQIPVYDEAAAQVRKILAAGIRPSHIDTHKHTHLFPPVLNAVARVAREFGIPWVRQRLGMKATLAGLRSTDHFVGFRDTGRLDEAVMIATLEKLPDGLKNTDEARFLYNFGCATTMDIVQLIYRPKEPQGASKDFEFSRSTMRARWAQGRIDAETTLAVSPWLEPMPPEVGARTFDVIHDLLVKDGRHRE